MTKEQIGMNPPIKSTDMNIDKSKTIVFTGYGNNHIVTDRETLAQEIENSIIDMKVLFSGINSETASDYPYCTLWNNLDQTTRNNLHQYWQYRKGIITMGKDDAHSLLMEIICELANIVLESESGKCREDMCDDEGCFFEEYQDRFNDLYDEIEDRLLNINIIHTKPTDMKTDSINNKGCSVCETGQENYTTFRPTHRPKQIFYQYDYRHTDGELFSTVTPTLEQCRKRRDEWLSQKAQKYVLFIGFKRLGEFDTILEAKKYADGSGLSGVFNILGKDDYRDSWYVFDSDIKRTQ